MAFSYSIPTILTLAVSVGTISCGKTSVSQVTDPSIETVSEAELATRVTSSTEEIFVEDGTLLKTADVGFTMTRIANLAPPTIKGIALQATKVVVHSSAQAYVSFNVAGETQVGAVDLLSHATKDSPKVTSEIRFLDSDINSLAFGNGKIYAVGASAETGGAFLKSFSVQGFSFSSDVETYPLKSFAGTGVVLKGDRVYATSGSGGGLTTFERSNMTELSYTDIADARDVSVGTSDIWTVKGTNGLIQSFDSAGVPGKTIDVGGATIPESKATVEAGKTTIVAALGDGGVSIACQADGTILASLPAVTRSGLSPADTVTNAASSADGLLFTANGEAGVYVYSMKTSGQTQGACSVPLLTLLGSLTLGDNFSANAVTYKNGYLYVATGLGGIDIISINRSKEENDFDDDND